MPRTTGAVYKLKFHTETREPEQLLAQIINLINDNTDELIVWESVDMTGTVSFPLHDSSERD